jgi:RNA recognition motif-containing protein
MDLPVLQHPLSVPTGEEMEERPADYQPSNTIYISNLNEKVPTDEMKDTLFNIFEEYGEIIDVSAES